MRSSLPRLALARSRIVMSLLSMLGCATSTKDLPTTTQEMRVNIEIEHLTTPTFARRSVRAVLTNAKGADVERDDVRIEMNGVPLRFRVSQGNYYDRHPYYTLDDDDRVDLTPGSELHFVLILPDSTRHEIGIVRAPAALAVDQFAFGPKPPTSGDVALVWRDLTDSAEVRIGRTELRKEAEGNVVVEGSGENDPDAPRRTIGPGGFRRRSDRWVLPESLLVSTAERTLLTLNAEIVSTASGKVSKEFSKQSSLTSTRRIRLEMEFATVQ